MRFKTCPTCLKRSHEGRISEICCLKRCRTSADTPRTPASLTPTLKPFSSNVLHFFHANGSAKVNNYDSDDGEITLRVSHIAAISLRYFPQGNSQVPRKGAFFRETFRLGTLISASRDSYGDFRSQHWNLASILHLRTWQREDVTAPRMYFVSTSSSHSSSVVKTSSALENPRRPKWKLLCPEYRARSHDFLEHARKSAERERSPIPNI